MYVCVIDVLFFVVFTCVVLLEASRGAQGWRRGACSAEEVAAVSLILGAVTTNYTFLP